MASSTVTNAKYLDYAGLSTLVGNIKTLVDNKIIAAKQVLGGELSGGLTATEVQLSLLTPSGFTVNGGDSRTLSTKAIPGATTSLAGVMTAADKAKLDGISASAEVNQKAYSTVIANGTNLSADSKTSTLTIIQGDGISITPSANGRAFSIANTYSYTHPEYAVTVSTASAALSSGSKFTVISTVTCGTNSNGHLQKIISKEFELPKLINDIKFSAKTASTPIANTVNVVYNFVDDTGIAGQSTASIQYNTIQVPTQKYVDSQIADKIATADALIYKGTKTPDSNGKIFLETDAKCGYLYKAASAGYVYVTGTTTQGQHVEAGDMIIANTDSPTTLAGWDIIERNIDGAVSGPASAVSGNIAIFDGTTGKLIKDGGKKISDLATSGHKHNITAGGSNGDSEITVGRSGGDLAVTYNISHNKKLNSTFTGGAVAGTADAWGESVTIKVPKLNINDYGHVTSASDVDYKITIPTPSHPSLDLTTYWGTAEEDSHDAYDPDVNTNRTWKVYKGVKSVTGGSYISVTSTNGEVVVSNTYKYTLPAATTTGIGGIKVYKAYSSYTVSANVSAISANVNSGGQYYGVEKDKNNAAFVYVPWTDTKVQSTTVSGGTHYLLGSDNSANETDYVYKRNNVYISDDEVLACAPSTVVSNTASKVITHSDAITIAMINALFA